MIMIKFSLFMVLSLAVAASKLGSITALDDYITTNYVAYPDRVLMEKDVEFLYNEYLDLFNKTESRFGFAYFNQNLRDIIQHNREGHSWTMALNRFADVSLEEFMLMQTMQGPQECSATVGNYKFKNAKIPEHVDWREKGAVSPVKNQGHCGSCWAFSTTATLEAHWKIFVGGEFLDLAKQQLVDCAGQFDNHGCQGGLPSHAFEYIRYAGGIQQEKDYPYRAENGKCKFDKSKVKATVPGGAVNITAGNENELDEALATVGPVAIAFQVVGDFRFYKSGVYSSKNCKNGPMDVNHAVLAVGYGVENGKKYYIVKNSWGTQWGMNGYFLIERGVNMCGTAQCNSYPKLDIHESQKVLLS